MRENNIFGAAILSLILVAGTSEVYAFHELGITSSLGIGTNYLQSLVEKSGENFEQNIEELTNKQTSGGEEGEPEGKELSAQQKLMSQAKKMAREQGKSALDAGISAVKSGNFNVKDIAGSMLEGAKPDLSNLDLSELASVGKDLLKGKKEAQKDIANAEAELKALDEVEKQERRDKIKAIEQAIMEKELALTAVTPGSDEALQFSMDLQDLKKQKQLLMEQVETDTQQEADKSGLAKKKDEIAKKYAAMKVSAQEKIDVAKEKYEQYANALQEVDIAKEMNNQADKIADEIFGAEEAQETQTLYTQIINDFFLGEDEEPNQGNISRIRQNRKRAYYQAVQDLFAAAIQSDGAAWQIGDDAEQAHAAITESAETNFGARVMQLSVDIQSVKSAARLTRMLLAKIRMETTEHIQSWTSYDKMKDYSQDVTLFNLDNYVFDPSLGGRLKTKANDLLKKGRGAIAQTGGQALQGAQDKIGQKLGQ